MPIVHKNEFGDKLIADYLEWFETYSIDNPTYGKISLHVVLGQALKNVHWELGSRKIDNRISMLLVKPQGSGKGAGYDSIVIIADGIGLDFQNLTESTDAGLVGTVDYDTEIKEEVVVPGLLQSADIVGMEEASVLFDYASDFSKKNMTYMQITMNPIESKSCTITKRLGKHTIEFKPHASFILLTYPPDKLVEKLVKTGFIDRLIFLYEDVTLIDRLRVIEKMSKRINKMSKKEQTERRESIIRRLNVVIAKYQKSDVRIKIPDEVHAALLQVIHRFSLKILDASPKARVKLEHFVSRLYEMLLRLATHHALLSKRIVLDMSDVLYANSTYEPIWTNLIVSIESLLIVDPVETMRKHKILRTALNEYDRQIKLGKFVRGKKNDYVRMLTMIENLRDIWDYCSNDTAHSNLNKLVKLPKETYDKFGKFAKYEKDKFFVSKVFGDTVYLKKIKDMK